VARRPKPDFVRRIPHQLGVLTDQYHGFEVEVSHQQFPATVESVVMG
jgi:hypothetical protein